MIGLSLERPCKSSIRSYTFSVSERIEEIISRVKVTLKTALLKSRGLGGWDRKSQASDRFCQNGHDRKASREHDVKSCK